MKEQLSIDQRLDSFMLGMEELRASQKETSEQVNAQIKELRESQKETKEQLKEVAIQLQKTDEQLQKTDEQLQRTDAKFDKSLKRWEGFIGNYADATEEYFYRSLEDTMKLGHISFDDI